MKYTETLFGKEGRDEMFKGIEIVHEAVGTTLGKNGGNNIHRRYGQPYASNDGAWIGRNVRLNHMPFWAMGADLIKGASERTNQEAGDGTTTTCILAYNLIKGGKDANNRIALRKELTEAYGLVLKELDTASTKVTSNDQLLDVANISVEDPDLAKIVVDAVNKAGDTGRVIVEESAGLTIEKEEIPGFEFAGGYVTPYMANTEKGEAVLTDTYVLVTDRSFSLNKDIIPVLDSVLKAGSKELLIICKKMEAEALQTVVLNRQKGIFHGVGVAVVKDKEVLEDIAALVGGVAITEEKGIKDIEIVHLGKAKKVVVNSQKTMIVVDNRFELTEKIYQDRITSLKTQIDESSDNEGLKDRLARLTASIVLLKVGANSNEEMKYLKDKIDDAVCSTRSAKEEGYVKGGGVTLMEIGKSVHNKLNTEGSKLLAEACAAPYMQLVASSGVTEKEYLASLDRVIDPTNVEKCAIKNSVSLAGMFITLDSVTEEFEKSDIIKQ